VGTHDDAILIVGGSLTAMGYLTRRKPFHDAPNFKPHQIFGELHTRVLDVSADESHEARLRESLKEDVLDIAEDDDGPWIWYDVEKIIAHGNKRKSIWREA
jgi:hypothetical protein